MTDVPFEHENQPIKKDGHLRILVVDDSVDSAQTLGWMLEPLGYSVEVANSGAAALETAKSFLPDIILLDISMPVMDGYQVCAAMRMIPGLENTIIIAQTGYDDMRQSAESKFDAHLVKPVSIEALQKILVARASMRAREACRPEMKDNR
jgi:CheY-like chemotaxis protein